MRFLTLIRQFVVRPLRRDKQRSTLTVLSVALGVAVVIAVELAGNAATGSFQSSMTSLIGNVDYEVTANGGVDERVMSQLTALPVNAQFDAVIEQPVEVENKGSVTLYGVESVGGSPIGCGFERCGGTIWAGRQELLSSCGAAIGQRVFRFRKLSKTRTWDGSQWISRRRSSSSIRLARSTASKLPVVPGEDAANVERMVRGTVPYSYDVVTPGARSEENQRMLRAFRTNLQILSYISLLVGAFLIYNTIAVSVVRRRAEIGILRALGVGSRGVLAIFLGEAAMLGLVGSLIGIGLGRLLASGMVGTISNTVNSIFVTSAPGTLAMSPEVIVASVATGTSVAVISALIPAREAARVAPAEAMRREAREHEAHLHVRRDLTMSACAALAAVGLSQFGPIDGRPVMGYAATLCAVAAAAPSRLPSLQRSFTCFEECCGAFPARRD